VNYSCFSNAAPLFIIEEQFPGAALYILLLFGEIIRRLITKSGNSAKMRVLCHMNRPANITQEIGMANTC